jgi:3D (Asp-Asp-Asp) domain-containing protein
VTSYRSVPEQTDDTPFYTSIGLHVKEGFCAVSQDQLGKSIHYGDILYVEIPAKPELNRYCMVADTMNKRNKRAIDFWVATKAQEHKVGFRRGHVYKLLRPHKETYMTSDSQIGFEVYEEALKTNNYIEAYKTIRDLYIKETIKLKSQILSTDLLLQDTNNLINELKNKIKQSKNELKGSL